MIYEELFSPERTIGANGQILEFSRGAFGTAGSETEGNVLHVEYISKSGHNGVGASAIDCLLPPSILTSYRGKEIVLKRDVPENDGGRLTANYNILDADMSYS